jgi:hypothetical protein
MTATLGAGVVNDYLILQYGKLIFGLLPARRFPPRWSVEVTREAAEDWAR